MAQSRGSSFTSDKHSAKLARKQRSQSKTPADYDPKAEQLAYYHYRLHRVDAIPMLRKNGDFILRRMKQEGKEKYAVSVRWGENVKHFPVQRQGHRFCFEARSYRHIRDLIEYHVVTGTPLTHASGARLERPKPRQPWELLDRQIEKKKKLGSGNFGTVFEAILTKTDGAKETVAVKTLDKVTAEGEDAVERARIEMLEEARVSREVSGHPNVVKSLGVTIDQEHPVAVMEVIRGSSLEKLLREESLDMETKLMMALKVAEGLEFIHRKGYIHRDMAARNCLVVKQGTKNGRLKLTDFGMARYVGDERVYKLSKATQMPIAWAAIESLEKLTWTPESDIWSLSVLFWEIFNDGAAPYNEYVNFGRDDAIGVLKSGKRMDIPNEVPPAVAETMKKCWDADPAKRPKLPEIRDALKRSMKKVGGGGGTTITSSER